ncbi:hypothetical protein [Streptomyces sp. NPDC057854]|uniref:hypothetical protein n=1 Tax=unclassified Streptomyces TaxID=2593676 RepID=UPI0036C1D440
MDVWNYFEGRPEIFAAVVALLVGVGAVLGAKIQANGGRAQAAAAREAAEIAAEAQREAALWTVRQVQIAEFIQGVREVRVIHDDFYKQNSFEGTLTSRLSEAEQAVLKREAAIRLVASEDVVEAVTEVCDAVLYAGEYAAVAGPVCYVQGRLHMLMRSDDPGDRDAAAQALEAVEEYHFAKDRPDLIERDRAERRAYEAVRESTGLSGNLVVEVLPALGSGFRAMVEGRERTDREVDEKVDDLVVATRSMLKSASPVRVPPPRRRWRCNSAPTPASSA